MNHFCLDVSEFGDFYLVRVGIKGEWNVQKILIEMVRLERKA
jgi:hypothetical protein